MTQAIISSPTLFEIIDVFGKCIRTTERWWLHIVSEKHEEMREKLDLVKRTIASPDQIRQSDEKPYIFLYYRHWELFWLCVVIRHLNGEGFLMTAYMTSKIKKKGVFVWQKKDNG